MKQNKTTCRVVGCSGPFADDEDREGKRFGVCSSHLLLRPRMAGLPEACPSFIDTEKVLLRCWRDGCESLVVDGRFDLGVCGACQDESIFLQSVEGPGADDVLLELVDEVQKVIDDAGKALRALRRVARKIQEHARKGAVDAS